MSENLINIANAVISKIKSSNPSKVWRGVSDDIDQAAMTGDTAIAAIRHWGDWVLPMDCEDEEDYDWKELSDHSATQIDNIISVFLKENKSVNITFGAGEKEWIYVSVSAKK
jgi:hypothetical protein